MYDLEKLYFFYCECLYCLRTFWAKTFCFSLVCLWCLLTFLLDGITFWKQQRKCKTFMAPFLLFMRHKKFYFSVIRMFCWLTCCLHAIWATKHFEYNKVDAQDLWHYRHLYVIHSFVFYCALVLFTSMLLACWLDEITSWEQQC